MRMANPMAIKNRSGVVPWIVTGGIALVLTWITLGHTGSVHGSSRVQIVPFTEKISNTLCMITHCMSRRHWLKNFLIDSVGNVVIFIPFGAAVLVALRHHSRPWLKATLLGLAALGAWFSAGILSIYRAAAPPANGPDRSPYSSADRGDSPRP
jgi:hypothetical protein